MVVENSGLLTDSSPEAPERREVRRLYPSLSGGNMDVITMSSMVQHGLIASVTVSSPYLYFFLTSLASW